MAIFVQSSPGFSWIWPYSSNSRRVLRNIGHISPILGGFCVKMAIFVQYPPGFRWIWPYLSNPRRVLCASIQFLRVTRRGLRGISHTHPILAEFSVNMTIFVQSSLGFAYIHTIFKSNSSGFAWHWSHPSNPRRVLHVSIQILRFTRRGWVSRKDIHQKTLQVSDSSNK